MKINGKHFEPDIPQEIGNLFNLCSLDACVTNMTKEYYEYENKILITIAPHFDFNKLKNNLTHINILNINPRAFGTKYNFLNSLPPNVTHLRIEYLSDELINLPPTLKYLYVSVDEDYNIEENINLPFGCELQVEIN